MRKPKASVTSLPTNATPPMTTDAQRDVIRDFAKFTGEHDPTTLAACVDTSMVAATLGATAALQSWFRVYASELQKRRAQ